MKPLGLFAFFSTFAFSSAQLPYTNKIYAASKPGFFKASAHYVVFSHSALGQFANATLVADAKQAVNQFKKEAAGMDKPRLPYIFDQGNHVKLSSNRLISVLTMIFADTAGAHPNTNYTTQNFALVNGKPQRIGIINLLKPGIRPVQIDDLVIAGLRDSGAQEVVENGVVGLTAQQRDRFTVSKEGLHYIFPPYDMGYYAQGAFQVDLTWNQLSPFLDRNGILKGVMD